MYRYHNRQVDNLVQEFPKHDPLIKWPTWGHMAVWKIFISTLTRFISNKPGRLLTLGRYANAWVVTDFLLIISQIADLYVDIYKSYYTELYLKNSKLNKKWMIQISGHFMWNVGKRLEHFPDKLLIDTCGICNICLYKQ